MTRRASRRLVIGATIFVVPISTMIATGRAQGTRSVWDGVYTDAQALRGKKTYADQCSTCHGADLMGGDSAGDVAPPLAGAEFMKSHDGSSVADLFDRIRTSMPQDAPGRLSPQQSAELVAYLLAANKLPAGVTDLAPRRPRSRRSVSGRGHRRNNQCCRQRQRLSKATAVRR